MSRELFRTPEQRAKFDQVKAEAWHAIQTMLTAYQEAVTEGASPDESMVATATVLRMYVRDTGGDLFKYLAMAVRIMGEKGVQL